jgi:adenine C2-methylase RlmN of 23S rRNA A2503 and tRNA A37
VKRECFLYKSSSAFNKHIYVDKGNAKEILKFIKENYDKFNLIRLRILETDHHYYPKYEKLRDYESIAEMRF